MNNTSSLTFEKLYQAASRGGRSEASDSGEVGSSGVQGGGGREGLETLAEGNVLMVREGEEPNPAANLRSYVYVARTSAGWFYVGETDDLRARILKSPIRVTLYSKYTGTLTFQNFSPRAASPRTGKARGWAEGVCVSCVSGCQAAASRWRDALRRLLSGTCGTRAFRSCHTRTRLT